MLIVMTIAVISGWSLSPMILYQETARFIRGTQACALGSLFEARGLARFRISAR
jgi:hypothetical protein